MTLISNNRAIRACRIVTRLIISCNELKAACNPLIGLCVTLSSLCGCVSAEINYIKSTQHEIGDSQRCGVVPFNYGNPEHEQASASLVSDGAVTASWNIKCQHNKQTLLKCEIEYEVKNGSALPIYVIDGPLEHRGHLPSFVVAQNNYSTNSSEFIIGYILSMAKVEQADAPLARRLLPSHSIKGATSLENPSQEWHYDTGRLSSRLVNRTKYARFFIGFVPHNEDIPISRTLLLSADGSIVAIPRWYLSIHQRWICTRALTLY